MYLTNYTTETAQRILLPLLEKELAEWINEEDYWTSNETAYNNAPLGVDVNVFDETFDDTLEEGEFKVAVHENIMVDGELTTNYSDTICTFVIKPSKCAECDNLTLMTYCLECEAKDDDYRNDLTCNECASDKDLCDC